MKPIDAVAAVATVTAAADRVMGHRPRTVCVPLFVEERDRAKTLHIRALEAKVKRLKQRIVEEQERTVAANQGAKALEAELRKKISEFDGAVVNLHLLRNNIMEKQAAAVEFDCENCRYCERNERPGCDRWRPDGNKNCGYRLPRLIDVLVNGVPVFIKTEINP